jgi:chaperonin GroEL
MMRVLIVLTSHDQLGNTGWKDAASVAGLLITTEAAVADLPEDKSAMPAMGGVGMSGMGGMDF